MTEKDFKDKARTFVEQIEVAGNQLIDEVKRLIREGNVRKLRLKDKDGDFVLELPVTAGVIVGGAVALTAPWLAVLGVVAGLIARIEIEVEREGEPGQGAAPETPTSSRANDEAAS